MREVVRVQGPRRGVSSDIPLPFAASARIQRSPHQGRARGSYTNVTNGGGGGWGWGLEARSEGVT